MEDNKKLEFTYCGDIKIEFANIRVIEIGSSLKFTLDERFPWINVYLGDNSDEGFRYFDEIDIESSLINADELVTIVLNYCVEHIRFITDKKMKEKVQKYFKRQEKEKVELDKQKNKLHDLLERGIYDVDTFLERQQTLAAKKEEIETAIKGTKKLLEVEVSRDIDYKELAQNIECAIGDYENTDNIELKNKALKTVIKEILYYKEKKRFAQFTLEVKFKI